MESKYYTPTIEEYYVGFECEYKTCKSEKWIYHTVQFAPNDDIFKNFFLTSETRVKLLDREDIESLGFSQITDDCFNTSNVNYRGRTNCDLRLLFRKTILIYIIEPKEITHTVFTGIIKNKSELRKLMNQLNIE